MQEYIGKKLDFVIQDLQNKGINYEIISNNHKVNGDTKLVTNIKTKDSVVYITVSDFIFDVKCCEDNKC